MNSHDDELKDSPLLKSLQGRQPFQAPEGYFDDLGNHISDRIQHKNRFRINLRILVPTLAVACLACWLILRPSTVEQQETAEITATYDDLIQSGYYTELDESLLAESFDSSPLPTDSSSQAMEDYLLNNSDETLLLNEL